MVKLRKFIRGIILFLIFPTILGIIGLSCRDSFLNGFLLTIGFQIAIFLLMVIVWIAMVLLND